MNRQERVQVADETIGIIEAGQYVSPTGEQVSIADAVNNAIRGVRLYTPEALAALCDAALPESRRWSTRFECVNETTLAAARRLASNGGGDDVLCLNFASAKNPGGGFLSGSSAQEESLARSSALYPTLMAAPQYYDRNRTCGTALYTDHFILSPDVPVFRDDAGHLLERPYRVSFLTAPAVNAGAVRTNEPKRAHLIRPTMERRARLVLAVAAEEGYQRLVLGAWGCGVFKNQPAEVADIFAKLLTEAGPFAGRFELVIFAVLDSSPGQSMLEPFRRRFPQTASGNSHSPSAMKGGPP